MAKKFGRRYLCLTCLLIILPTRGFSQTSLVPTIVVGKAAVKAIKDADDRSLTRALILSQFLAQRGMTTAYPYNVTVVIAPTEISPYTTPSPYPSYGPQGSSYSYYKPSEGVKSPLPVSTLQMRINIETWSTTAVWNDISAVTKTSDFSKSKALRLIGQTFIGRSNCGWWANY